VHKSLVCTVCPMSCNVSLELDENGQIISVSGNRCPRGKTYAIKEHTAPERTLTTTVRAVGGVHPLLPVRTDKPIPKGLLLKAREETAELTINAPVKMGDVIIPDFLGTGANLVASRDL
jgi:CxxC motif-containing protein